MGILFGVAAIPKCHMVSWDTICKPKESRGAGFSQSLHSEPVLYYEVGLDVSGATR